MMYMERYEVDLYWRLYPPGWCLISALETVHRYHDLLLYPIFSQSLGSFGVK